MSSLVALSIGLGSVIIVESSEECGGHISSTSGAQIDQILAAMFERLLAIRLELKKGSTGALAGMMRELEALRDFFASATLTAVVDVPFIILTLLVVWVIGGAVVIVPALMVPMVVLIGWLTHPALERLSARSLGEAMQKQSVLVEAIGGLETVKTSGGAFAARRWRSRAGAFGLRYSTLVSSIGVTFATSPAPSPMRWSSSWSYDRSQDLLWALIACSILAAGRAAAGARFAAPFRLTSTAPPTADHLVMESRRGRNARPQAGPFEGGSTSAISLPLSRAPERALEKSASRSTRASMSPCWAASARESRPSRG